MTIVLLAVSIVPALAFLVIILRMDRREPEPLLLVVKVVGLGAASGIAALVVELLLDGIPAFHAAGLAGAAARSFLQVAPVEELAKLAVVLLFVWRNPSFNEENDGIVYMGASAIGFSVLENISYVLHSGIGTGVLRAFTAIPLHVFTAVALGLFVGRARFAARAAARVGLVAAGFVIAWAIHGAYDTLAMSGTALAGLLLPLLAGLAAFGIAAMKRGRRLSLLRWGPGIAAAPAALPTRSAASAPSNAHRWVPVVSRVLLAACGLFWALIIIGLAQRTTKADAGMAVLGATLITIIPASIGILMEIAHHRHRRRA